MNVWLARRRLLSKARAALIGWYGLLLARRSRGPEQLSRAPEGADQHADAWVTHTFFEGKPATYTYDHAEVHILAEPCAYSEVVTYSSDAGPANEVSITAYDANTTAMFFD
jgi:hypothetical protein